MTVKLLQSLTNRVRVVIYYNKNEGLYSTVSSLLDEYKLVNPKFSVETVDYLRDPGGAQKVKTDYKLASAAEKNLVIFECEGKVLVVDGKALANWTLEQVPNEKELEFRNKPIAFAGEKMFTSALLAVTNPKPLNAYFLQGHGEHRLDGADPVSGYLKFQAVLQQNYIRVQPISLLGTNPVPLDCNLMIVAGPTTAIPALELEKIQQYLNQGGRLLALERHAERDPTRNPAHRRKSFDEWKVALRIRQMMKGERVAQCQRGHVGGAIGDQHGIKCAERRQPGQQAQQHASQDAEKRQKLFRGKITVCNQADKKRRDHRANCECAVGQTDLPALKAQRLAEISGHAHVPRAPNEVLEEHEDGELGLKRGLHGDG